MKLHLLDSQHRESHCHSQVSVILLQDGPNILNTSRYDKHAHSSILKNILQTVHRITSPLSIYTIMHSSSSFARNARSRLQLSILSWIETKSSIYNKASLERRIFSQAYLYSLRLQLELALCQSYLLHLMIHLEFSSQEIPSA